MADVKRVGDLEVGQDLKFQRRMWLIQRVAWVVWALLLLTALAGLLGPGPLSRATAGERGSLLWVEYNRYERYQAPVILRAHIGPGAGRDGRVRLSLNRAYVENVELQGIHPEPSSTQAGPDQFVYVFELPDTQQPTAITFHLRGNHYGWLPVRLGLEGGQQQVSFNQFFYP